MVRGEQPLFLHQVGNDIDGIEEWGDFGCTLGFCDDGNAIVASAQACDEYGALVGQVHAYSYQEESSDWKAAGTIHYC